MEGKGPFSELGQDVFDLYWKYYPKYRMAKVNYRSLPEFLAWLPQQDEHNISLLHQYDHKAMLKTIEQYQEKHA